MGGGGIKRTEIQFKRNESLMKRGNVGNPIWAAVPIGAILGIVNKKEKIKKRKKRRRYFRICK